MADVKEVEGKVHKEFVYNRNQCRECGSIHLVMKNYSMMWHDGDLHCADCDEFVRTFDAG